MTAQPFAAHAYSPWLGPLVCTDHAARRLNQRGLSPDDVRVVLAHGEWVEDGCMLSEGGEDAENGWNRYFGYWGVPCDVHAL